MIDLLGNASDDNIAVIDSAGCHTYSELNALVNSFKAFCSNDTLVIILCENVIEIVALYICCLREGSVPILVDNTIGDVALQRLIDAYSPNVVWSTTERDIRIEHSQTTNGLCRSTLSQKTVDISQDLGLLLTTSGSTGSPKLVRISYKNLIANTQSICEYLEISADSRHITTLPMAYTYGLSCINTHLWSGACIILNENSVVERGFWETVERHKPTTLAGVPYTYELLQKVGLDRVRKTTIRTFTQAGGGLSKGTRAAVYAELVKHGKDVWVMYGQTEATARMAYLPPEMFTAKDGSIGLPIPGGSFSISEVNKDGTGELVYRGDNVCLGYAESKADLMATDVNNGVLYTGDIARVDDDGYWYITGRNSRFAKIMGKRVNLRDIEDLLETKGWKNACKLEDNRIIIYVEEKNGNSHVKEVKSFVRDQFGFSPTLMKVVSIAVLPRSSSGKIAYSSL